MELHNLPKYNNNKIPNLIKKKTNKNKQKRLIEYLKKL